MPLSGSGVDDADPSLLALNEERERNALCHDFHSRANRVYRLAETMGMDTLEHVMIVHNEIFKVLNEEKQLVFDGSNISGHRPVSFPTLMAVTSLKGEYGRGQNRRRRRGKKVGSHTHK